MTTANLQQTKSQISDDTLTGTETQQHGLYKADAVSRGELLAQDREGNVVEGFALNVRMIVTGGSKRWNTGFPDWQNQESYGGTLRLQNADTGDQMICSYIETATQADCHIVIGNIPGRLIEARDTDTVGYGADNRVTNGFHAWSTWVKFHYQDVIYSGILTCYC